MTSLPDDIITALKTPKYHRGEIKRENVKRKGKVLCVWENGGLELHGF